MRPYISYALQTLSFEVESLLKTFKIPAVMSILYLWSDRGGDGHQNRVSASSPSVGIYLEDLLPIF